MISITITHELVHAWQHQYFPLDSLAMALPGGWDRVRQMIRDAQGTMPVFSTAPMFIQESLLFPYLSGAEFVRNFKQQRPGQMPFRPPPTSTKQVIRSEEHTSELQS